MPRDIANLRAWRKNRYIKHKAEENAQGIKWKKEHNTEEYRKYKRDYMNLHRNDYIEGWKDIIPEQTNCEVCGTIIRFNSGNALTSICFDHRNEGREIIKCPPAKWLRQNKHNVENERIWKSCNFGMICHSCNRRLPTINRTEWLLRAAIYDKKSKI